MFIALFLLTSLKSFLSEFQGAVQDPCCWGICFLQLPKSSRRKATSPPCGGQVIYCVHMCVCDIFIFPRGINNNNSVRMKVWEPFALGLEENITLIHYYCITLHVPNKAQIQLNISQELQLESRLYETI